MMNKAERKRKLSVRPGRIIYFTVCLFFLFTVQAHAYIDPSVMTYAIQAIAGIAIALGTFFNVYWRRLRKKIGGSDLFGRGYRQTESDELFYDDPVSGTRIRPDIKDTAVNIQKERKPFWKKFWSEYKYALILSAVVAFLVMVFSPLDYYFNNVNDFWFDFGVVLPLLLKLWLLVFLALSALLAVCLLLFDELYHIVYIGIFALFLCAYIQGNILAGKLPALDGTAIDWSQYHIQMLQSRYLWSLLPLAVLLTARFARMKGFYKLTKYINLAVSAMLAVSLVFAGIQNHGFIKKEYRIGTSDHLFEMSSEKNFIILMIDALDAREFARIMEENPEYGEYFRDFTFFPDTVGAYTFTNYAMPQILSGKWMENQTDYQSYVTDAMDNSPLFENLENRNYKMGVYETKLLYNSDNIYRFENYIKGDVCFGSMNAFLSEEMPLFFFKYSPYQLKRYFQPDLQYFYHTMSVRNASEVFSDLNPDFYDKVLNAEVVKTDDKCFRFIHIEGAHTPFRYNPDVVPIPESEGSYEQNVLCSITIMNAYLKRLQEAGVYDNSAIIIMGDHGFNYDNNEYWGRWNPALLIKGIDEQHEFSVSQAPLSYDDLQEAYSRLLDGKTAEESFDAREGDIRERRYMHYIREEKITEYIQKGYASDADSMEATGRVFEREIDYLSEFHNN